MRDRTVNFLGALRQSCGFLEILVYLLEAFPAKDFTGGGGIPAIANTIVYPPTTRDWFVLPIPD